MALAVSDAAEALSSSDIENKFKMAQVLQIRGDFPRAITVFQNVCVAVERVARANPSAHVELHQIPLSLGHLSEIYLKKEDQQKALALIQCQKKFFEYIASNLPNLESENSTDGASDLPEHDLPDLFREMHATFEMADAPPPRDPQEVVQMVLEAKKKYEQEQAAANLSKLKQIMADREAKKNTSRWLQTLDYIDQHPIRVTLGAVVFMLVFLAITVISFDTRKLAGRDDKAGRRDAGRKAPRAPGQKGADPPHRDPKTTAEEIQKLKDTLESMRKNSGREGL
jgi:hypothetical protein